MIEITTARPDVEQIEEAEFLRNIDYYIEAAEAGRRFELVRNTIAICLLNSVD